MSRKAWNVKREMWRPEGVQVGKHLRARSFGINPE